MTLKEKGILKALVEHPSGLLTISIRNQKITQAEAEIFDLSVFGGDIE